MYPIFIVAGFPLTFANAAVVGATCQRLRGEDPTIGSALRAAWERRGRLVVWAVLGGLIGVILQAVLERLKLGGRIAMWTIGLAWQLAITFVIPVLMFEDTTVPGAVRRSASLFKERWGPSVRGQGAIYAAMIVVILPVTIVLSILTVVLAAAAPSPVAIGVLVTVWVGVFIAMIGITTTLDGVFKTVLYHYAVTGDAVQPFGADDLAATYRPKTRRHWFRKR
jgi:hypothetical protein